MAGQTTKPYKNTLSGSIGAGMGSLFSPGGRKYYILEHRVTTKYHKAGESQEIIVDNIELGRDSRCQVRFDESFQTVSRHHAAIVREGDMWKLVQISTTNSTLLNGRPVKKEWYLQNGDEIQLSVNGPKLGFIVPTGKRSTVKSIGLTRRLSLFRQQALRPYKYAIAGLSACLVLAIAGLGTWNYLLHQQLVDQSKSLAQQIIMAKGNKQLVDSLTNELDAANKKISSQDVKIAAAAKKASKVVVVRGGGSASPAAVRGSAGAPDLSTTFKDVYYIDCSVAYGEQEYPAWSGTGFLLDNGYFVTAQHCIHWDMIGFVEGSNSIDPGSPYNVLNFLYYGGQLKIIMRCYSTSDKFKLEYTYDKIPFTYHEAPLAEAVYTDERGQSHVVRMHQYNKAYKNDWAYVNLGKKGSLAFDAEFSKNMPVQTTLSIVGFPAGQGAQQSGKVSPVVSQGMTSRVGLEDDGTIKVSNDDSDHGNSGGPVFALKNGKYVVVGILSGVTAGSDITHRKGRVTPICNIFK